MHIFDQPGLTVNTERGKEDDEKTWDATNRAAALQRHTHTQSTHITQGSVPVTTQYMSERHKKQTNTGIILVCVFCKESSVLEHILGKYASGWRLAHC